MDGNKNTLYSIQQKNFTLAYFLHLLGLSQWQIQDFPEEGVPTAWGAPTYDFAKIFQKLHEIERIWTPRGPRPSSLPLDPPLLPITAKGTDMIAVSVRTILGSITLFYLSVISAEVSRQTVLLL